MPRIDKTTTRQLAGKPAAAKRTKRKTPTKAARKRNIPLTQDDKALRSTGDREAWHARLRDKRTAAERGD